MTNLTYLTYSPYSSHCANTRFSLWLFLFIFSFISDTRPDWMRYFPSNPTQKIADNFHLQDLFFHGFANKHSTTQRQSQTVKDCEDACEEIKTTIQKQQKNSTRTSRITGSTNSSLALSVPSSKWNNDHQIIFFLSMHCSINESHFW